MFQMTDKEQQAFDALFKPNSTPISSPCEGGGKTGGHCPDCGPVMGDVTYNLMFKKESNND